MAAKKGRKTAFQGGGRGTNTARAIGGRQNLGGNPRGVGARRPVAVAAFQTPRQLMGGKMTVQAGRGKGYTAKV